MIKLNRWERVTLYVEDNNRYKVFGMNDYLAMESNEDYFIYLKNVVFTNNGMILGWYLGEVNDESIIDDFCKDVKFNKDNGFNVDGNPIMEAKMIAIDNKNKTVIIVE